MLDNHGSNSDSLRIEGNDLDPTTPDPETMSLAELNISIDAEMIRDTSAELLLLPPALRQAALADFAEIDPALARKVELALMFAL